jgi:hypothetical protein
MAPSQAFSRKPFFQNALPGCPQILWISLWISTMRIIAAAENSHNCERGQKISKAFLTANSWSYERHLTYRWRNVL